MSSPLIFRTLPVFILLLYSGSAFAVDSYWNSSGSSSAKPWFTSGAAGCAAKTYPSGYIYGGVTAGADSVQCIMKQADGQYPTYSGNMLRFTVAECPSGQTRNLATGSCDTPPPPPKKCNVPSGGKVTWTQDEGTGPIGGTVPTSGTRGFPTTSPTCGITGSPDLNSCRSSEAGGVKSYVCTYTGTSNGADAPSDAPQNASPGPDSKPSNMPPKSSGSNSTPCPNGTTQGGVDSSGIPICMGSGTNPDTPSKPPVSSSEAKSTDANGNQVSTSTVKTTNSDGSVTTSTTTTTTKPDGSSTTTKGDSTSAAADGKNGQPDKPESDLCKQHPELTICKNSAVRGSCATIACEGDAIQCATLQQAAALRCARDDDEKALKALGAFTLGQSVLAGNDPLASTLPKSSNATAVTVPGTLSTSGWLGAGSCFADKTVSVMGRSVVLPFSEACGILVALRYALMAAAALVSFKILRSSFLSE